jgi:hypothetical protein
MKFGTHSLDAAIQSHQEDFRLELSFFRVRRFRVFRVFRGFSLFEWPVRSTSCSSIGYIAQDGSVEIDSSGAADVGLTFSLCRAAWSTDGTKEG